MNKRLEDWVNWILIDELKSGIINAPKHLLGNHDYGDGQVIMVYRRMRRRSVSYLQPERIVMRWNVCQMVSMDLQCKEEI